MRDTLSCWCPVVDYHSEATCYAFALGYLGGRQEKMPHQHGIFSRCLAEAGEVFARDDQYVSRCLGIQVAKGKRVFILPEHLSRETLISNLAENTINHSRIVAEIRPPVQIRAGSRIAQRSIPARSFSLPNHRHPELFANRATAFFDRCPSSIVRRPPGFNSKEARWSRRR